MSSNPVGANFLYIKPSMASYMYGLYNSKCRTFNQMVGAMKGKVKLHM
jgi:hypothetical protein